MGGAGNISLLGNGIKGIAIKIVIGADGGIKGAIKTLSAKLVGFGKINVVEVELHATGDRIKQAFGEAILHLVVVFNADTEQGFVEGIVLEGKATRQRGKVETKFF